jgi:hypothetical protein
VIALLAVLFLNSTTELHQLSRLSLLLNHYRHHQSEDSGLTFWSFLQLHYTDTHPDDKDDDKDRELPFKTGDINHTDVPLYFYTQADLPLPFYTKDIPAFRHPEGIPGSRSFAVFHPPQLS